MSTATDVQEQTSEDQFLRRVSKLRAEWSGKTILSYGGAWTAEATEPNRKQKLHEQLRLARQLRALLETAALKAERADTRQERLEIFNEHTHHVNTLVSLTEAVRGGYTLKDYGEYARFYNEFDASADESRRKNHEVIVNQLVTMAEERSSLSAENSTTEAPRIVPPNDTRRQSSSTAARKRSKSPVESISANVGKDALARISISYIEDEDGAPIAKKSRLPKATVRKQKKHQVNPIRRCHDCKSNTSIFRRCHFWFLTGNKCQKTFCSRCLIDKYGCTDKDDDTWESNNTDWHCPSCIGICSCAECEKERKRGTRKESIYATRATSS